MSSITLSFHPPTPTPTPSVSPEMQRERVWRRAASWVIAICAFVILLSLVRFSFVRGVLRPIRVEGGSMAESLCGDHLLAVCQDCGYRVQCDVDSIPGDGDLLCPNCGYPANSERDAQPVRGERVLVDAFPATLGNLRRWDVVAVSQFGGDAGPIVKRLVAMPGEQWEIRQGDLWINGAVQPKSLEQLRSMMVTVNDDRYRPASQQRASRWRAGAAGSAWSDEGGRFRFEPPTEAEGQADDWLTYHHQRGLGATAGSELATTVKDLDAYNQAESRTLVPINDLGAAFRLQVDDAREVALAVTGHEGRLTCTLQISKGRILLMSENDSLADLPLRWHDWRQATLLEFGICDRQFLVGINGREILRAALGAEPVLPTSEPVAIALTCRRALVSRLRLWRDVHYLDPHGRSTDWRPAHGLAAGQFAVLGDNPPVSIDSRHTAAPIRQEDLWGHVRRPFQDFH